jgi:hypothetical protein
MMAAQEIPFGVDEQLGIAELLQIIGLRSRTGQLFLTSDRGRAVMDFVDGRVTNGDLLPAVPGSSLAGLAPGERRRAHLADIQRTLVEVLGWPRGRAAFQPALSFGAPELAHDVDVLLIEAVRALDEWQNDASALPSPGDCLIWADSPPTSMDTARLTHLQQQLLPLCNGRLSLTELARQVHAGDLDVMKAARELLERQFVRRNSDVEQVPFDAEAEALLNRRAVELQVRTAALPRLRSRDRQVQVLLAIVLDAVGALTLLLRRPAGTRAGRPSVGTMLERLQQQYGALELVALSDAGLETGDLIEAHAELSGGARDVFYAEAIDGLYDFLLHLAVCLVEDRMCGRVAAERVRSTLAALLLEIEMAVRSVKPPALLAAGTGPSALRQKHFHMIA